MWACRRWCWHSQERILSSIHKSLNICLNSKAFGSFSGAKISALNNTPYLCKTASFTKFGYLLSSYAGKNFSGISLGKSVLQQRSLQICNHGNRGINQRTALQMRFISTSRKKQWDEKNKSALLYITAIGVFMIGMGYAGVPLYRMFCQATGLGGQPVQGHRIDDVENMTPVRERLIEVRFNADTASSMQWNFRPQQTDIKVAPGETALAFYTAKNPTDKPIIGISTYNVLPFEAGQYFNKIQCFCFEEQRLNPHEQVDMPVFFYIDPAYAEDPKLQDVNRIILSYTFFEAKEGMKIPLPGYMQQGTNKQVL